MDLSVPDSPTSPRGSYFYSPSPCLLSSTGISCNINTHVRTHQTDIVVVHVHLLSGYVSTHMYVYICMYVLGDAFLPPPPLTPPRHFDTHRFRLPSKKVLWSLCWKCRTLGSRFGPLFFFFQRWIIINKSLSLSMPASHPLSWPLPPGRGGSLD